MSELYSLSCGDSFAEYTIEKPLGRGGMAEVYLAKHTYLDDSVALKVAIASDIFSVDEVKALFKKECLAFGKLRNARHKNLIRIDHAGVFDGRPFLAMDNIVGVDLAELMKEDCVSDKFALRIVADVASGLEAIHNCGIVHKDINPKNIRITGRQVSKIIDFGIAEFLNKSDSDSEFTFGTMPYMAPENFSDAVVDHRADIYSLGRVLYDCLLPDERWLSFGLCSVESQVKNLLDFVPRSPDSSSGLYFNLYDTLCTMLDPCPDNRFDSAKIVCEILMDILHSSSEHDASSIDFDSFIQDIFSEHLFDLSLLKGPFFLVKPEWYSELTGQPCKYFAEPELDDVLYLKNAGTDTSFYSIGRGNDCDVVVKDRRVSRSHALLIPAYSIGDKFSFKVIDNGSENGLRINGRKIKQSFIQSGDALQFAPGIVYIFSTTADLMNDARNNVDHTRRIKRERIENS